MHVALIPFSLALTQCVWGQEWFKVWNDVRRTGDRSLLSARAKSVPQRVLVRYLFGDKPVEMPR